MATLHTLLSKYRKRSGFTQKELSKKIHFSHSVISRVERAGSGYIPSKTYIDTFSKEVKLNKKEKTDLYQAFEDAQKGYNQQGISNTEFRFSTTFQFVLIFFIFLFGFGFMYFNRNNSVSSVEIFPTTNPSTKYQNTAINGILYSSNFENQVISGWKKLNNGDWDIFRIGGNYSLGVQNQDPDAIPNIYLSASKNWVNYSVKVDVEFTSGRFEQIYIVVRSSQEQNCSGYRIGGNRLGVTIFRFDTINNMCDGQTIAEDIHFPLSSGRYAMQVEVIGDQIQYFINDKLVLTAMDKNYPQGGFGFLAYEVKEAYFDNVVVTKLGE